MKTEEPLLDRAGVYRELQRLLAQDSSSSVLGLLPAETRDVWAALGAAGAAAAAKHARAGETAEVQEEMSLQRLQQLLEEAASGVPVILGAAGERVPPNSAGFLLNKIIPQILAAKPPLQQKDFMGRPSRFSSCPPAVRTWQLLFPTPHPTPHQPLSKTCGAVQSGWCFVDIYAANSTS